MKYRKWIAYKKVGLTSKMLIKFSVPVMAIILTNLLFTLTATAQFQKKLDINYQKSTLRTVLNDLKQKTGVTFTYDKEIIDETILVSSKLQQSSLETILGTVLTPVGYTFQIDKNIVFIIKSQKRTSPANTQRTIIVSGKVTDAQGKPISGATISVKELQNVSTVTDATGSYFMHLPDEKKYTLTFSYMGKKSIDTQIGNRIVINITLEDAVAQIDDVVVTGIFKKSRESYTGAVSTITKEQLSLYKGQNLIQTLRNIDPAINIIVNNNLGSNPNALPEINIRGNSSLPLNVQEFNEGVRQKVNTPLIIMDGFEISLTKLMDYNDQEIESINILKDAAATAIYGSRGSNGVIVIVTKAPKPGKLRISYQAGVNIEAPDLTSYSLLDAEGKLHLERLTGLYSNANNATTEINYQNLYQRRLKNVLEGVNTDWLSQPVRTGIGQRHNLRLEGGGEEFRWGTTLGYNNISGAMKGSVRNNFNGAITLSYTYKNLLFRNQTNVGINKGIESKYGSLSSYANAQPYESIHDENGEMRRYFLDFYQTGRLSNPLYDASLNNLNQSKYTEIINNFSIEWNLTQSLMVRGQLGLSKRMNSSDIFLSPEHSSFLSEVYQGVDGSVRKGTYDYGTGEDVNGDANLTLSYSKLIKAKHQIYAAIDYSIAQRSTYNYQFGAEGFSDDGLGFLGNALQYRLNGKPTANEDINRRLGITSNATYTYDNRLFIDASLRIDGSSQFGSRNKFAPFWSTGIGWNLHNESFLKNNATVSTLRLRGSIGETGSQQFAAYQALSTFEYYTDQRYALWNASRLMGLGNENLKWQITDQLNGGLEFALFNNRLSGSFDLYKKQTSNLLSAMNIPLATGFSTYTDNVGEVQNLGFESALSGFVVKDDRNNFTWMLSTKLAYNRNKITQLSDAVKMQNQLYRDQNVEVSNLFFEGRPQNSIYAVRSKGIDPSSGKEVYIDRDGNITDQWNPSDKVFLGSAEPLFRGNMSSLTTYKNLTLNLSFGVQWGGYMYNQTLVDRVEVSPADISSRNVDKRVLEQRWVKEGDVTFFKGFADSYSTRGSSRFVMDQRIFELQSMSLQYRFDTQKLKRFKIESLMLGINMSNVFYFSTIQVERGIDYPFARNISTNISLTF
ncbi:SusC/RagA family TonB-linked outer membrane protein [Sphingobacterium faecale]|uniref:SusC/RagA family TonB-linked outer membrane protein n=1 Tax=Sphingobacterium faecale TaxID=2803775 RepID=A0ABS1R696_9SPHI|nr:SusC/RagA family TonB-linked outer membrane protein [Sphingobacterium faecale]MBL1410040.1 SusC/RagA family TonB-linked outer membrane protein [Sphingobacterium faecale]